MSRSDVGAARVAALVLSAVAACAGCGSSEQDGARSGEGSASDQPHAGGADMVAAVSASPTPGAVELRFELSARPAVGQPLDIRLVLTPTVELDALNARFTTAEGLELVKGAETPQLDRPVRGTPVSHTVTVIPKSDGIFYVTATVNTDSPKESVSRKYSIPIIAGAGLPEGLETPPATAGSKHP